MPLSKVTPRPGIVSRLTATLAEGCFVLGNLVRFPAGIAQPIGGWTKATSSALDGVCRAILSWARLTGARLTALATHKRLYVLQLTTLTDITPIASTATLGSNPIATTNGLTAVTITHTAHGQAAGTSVLISGATAVGGITLSGEYVIVAPVAANTYTVTAAGAATSTTSGGGSAVQVQYLLAPGAQDAATGQGWGVGYYGADTFGTVRGDLTYASYPRLWSLDAWGEELLACLRDGGLYRYRPATDTRAALISGAPTNNKGVFVGMPERHAILFGGSVGGVQDPMLVQWSDTENYSSWTATATNAAGSFRLAAGSQIVAGLRAPGEHLIWTDMGLVGMRFLGNSLVYGFREIGLGCGLVAPKAVVVHDSVAYWMSQQGFRRYAGQVEAIPCDVRDAVFGSLTAAQATKVFAGYNSLFGEAVWFYPGPGMSECDRYVSLDVASGAWSMGLMARTAWADAGVFPQPMGASPGGSIYWHEQGTDADGSPMNPYVETGWIDMADGTDVMALTEVLPDFSVADGAAPVLLTVKAQDAPAALVRSKGPFTITSLVRRLSPRLRGRQMALRVESNALGASWRWGAPRARVAPDGRR